MAWFQSKQQKLAVEMWEYIKEQISNGSSDMTYQMKERFACSKGLQGESHWHNDCWLCENSRNDCSKCPLKSCEYNTSTYGLIDNPYSSKELRLCSCDEIIQAIKDTNRYYVLEDNRLTTVPKGRKTKFEGTLKACLAFVDCIKGLEEDEVE